MMTTEGDLYDSCEDWEDEAVVGNIAALKEQVAICANALHGLEVEALRRLQERGGTILRSAMHTVELKYGSPSYDVTRLIPILELITDDDIGKAFTPAHEVTSTVHESWNGTQLRRIEREYGGKVAETVASARVQGAPRIDFKERKA